MNMTYYLAEKIPLEEVSFEEIPVGGLVYNEVGKCMQKIQAGDGNCYMKEMYDSVLVEGEIMKDLTIKQLKLFWALSRNKGKRWYNESKDNGKRERLL